MNAYDGPGNLISVTDQAGNVAQYSYDAANQLVSTIQASSPNAPADTTVVGYDADGNPITLEDANTHTTASLFDLAAELTEKTLPDGSSTETRTYDSKGNLASVAHFNGVTTTYTYDAFGNISKTANGLGSSFLPSSYTNNQAGGYSYDGTGDMLTDNLHNSYTWDIYGDMLSATSGGSTTNVFYDALGRAVEYDTPGGYNYVSLFAPGVQQPVGSILNGSLNNAVFPMPGGTQVMYASQGLFLYYHSDWLGSARTSSYPSGGLVYSNAYAPFGESYATNGTTGNLDFTGQSQDMASGIYDFPFRHLSASQGRWLSPDPAGVAAVDITNPQSWNRYAYVLNNPLAAADSLELGVPVGAIHGLIDCATK